MTAVRYRGRVIGWWVTDGDGWCRYQRVGQSDIIAITQRTLQAM